MSRKVPADSFAAIASKKFDEIMPEIIEDYKPKLESDNIDEIQELSKEISKDVNEAFRDELPDYKILSHVEILQKGESSLFEGTTLFWESDIDCFKEYKFENDKYYLMCYVCFIPTKVPTDFK